MRVIDVSLGQWELTGWRLNLSLIFSHPQLFTLLPGITVAEVAPSTASSMGPAFWNIHANLPPPCGKEGSTLCWLSLGSSWQSIKGVLWDSGSRWEDSEL